MKRFLPASFEKQILLALFAVGWVPVGLALMFTGILTRRNLMESESERISARAEQISLELQHYFDLVETEISQIQADPLLSDPQVPDDAKIRELQRHTDVSSKIIDITLHDQPYPLAERLKGNQIHVRLPTAIPNRDSGPELRWWAKLNGTDQWIEVSTSLAGIWRMLDDVIFPPNGNVALVSANGLVLSHRDKKLIHHHLPVHTIDSQTLAMQGSRWAEFFTFTFPFQTEKKKSDLNLQLVCFLPKSTVNDRIIKQLILNTLIGMVISLFSIWVGRRLSKNLSLHINQAAEVSVTISEGDLEARIPEQGPTEICTLAKSFNEMVGTLQEHQETLEETVAERTSHLERTAAQLQAAHDASKDGLWLVNTDRSGHTLNETFCEMFDVPISESTRSTELLENVAKWFSDEDTFFEWATNALKTPDEVETTKWQLTDNKVCSTYAAPVKDSKGETLAVLFSFTDLTEETRLHQELAKSRSMETVGHLSGSIAHEFNNLLTQVIGNIEIAAEDEANSSQAKALQEAHESSRKAAELVRGMLSFSQQNWLKIEEHSVGQLIKQTLSRFTVDQIGTVTIEVGQTEGIPMIHADEEKIVESLEQIISNSLDATAEDGRLEIKTRHLPNYDDLPHGAVEITIQDNGAGITAEMQDTMFEPFVSSTKGRKGLGLSICHGIIEQHAGSITCDSNLGKGTTFRVAIPATAQIEKAEIAEQPSDTSKPTNANHHLPAQKIMVVDDDEGVRLVTSLSLKKGGYQVVAFESGTSALEYFEQNGHEIGLVVLDLRMPVMMGTEVLEKLRKQFDYVPVIICSGYLRDLDDLHDPDLGPDATLEKPVPPSIMLNTVKEMLEA